MGDPMRPLMWVSKSHAKLAAALREMGHKIADSSIPKLLGLLKYSRQVNRKTLEGSHNADRNAQFEINTALLATQAAGQPETGLTIRSCHYPPGTSKWNRIEHRLF